MRLPTSFTAVPFEFKFSYTRAFANASPEPPRTWVGDRPVNTRRHRGPCNAECRQGPKNSNTTPQSSIVCAHHRCSAYLSSSDSDVCTCHMPAAAVDVDSAPALICGRRRRHTRPGSSHATVRPAIAGRCLSSAQPARSGAGSRGQAAATLPADPTRATRVSRNSEHSRNNARGQAGTPDAAAAAVRRSCSAAGNFCFRKCIFRSQSVMASLSAAAAAEAASAFSLVMTPVRSSSEVCVAPRDGVCVCVVGAQCVRVRACALPAALACGRPRAIDGGAHGAEPRNAVPAGRAVYIEVSPCTQLGRG